MRSGAKYSVSKAFRCALWLALRSGFWWTQMSTAEVRRKVQMNGLGAEDELCLRIIWDKLVGGPEALAEVRAESLAKLGK